MNQAFVADPVFLDPVYEPLDSDYEEMREMLRTHVMVPTHYGTIVRSLRWSRNLRDPRRASSPAEPDDRRWIHCVTF